MKSLVRALVIAVLIMVPTNQAMMAQVATPNADSQTQQTISSDALEMLPSGDPGEVSVIAVGSFPQRAISIPILIRNNTDQPVYEVSLKAEIWDADGKLVGVANEAYGVYPIRLNPGDVALTVIQPDPDKLPAEVEFTFAVDYKDAQHYDFLSDIGFGTLTFSDNRLLGEVGNPNDFNINDFTMLATCIDDTGTPFNFEIVGVDELVEPGNSTTFQIDIWGDPCENYLVTGYASKS